MEVAAIIVAAGRGTRAQGALPKQWRPLAGRPVVAHALAAFGGVPRVSEMVLVGHPDDMARARALDIPGLTVVAGGATRRGSVLAGLE
uniref:2-C-methyl-D-erythritol 4-phosphate cytidylyltransferase n=1 Tax=Roseovarius halophilus (ex Wu et al. 2025) TaxID=3376060 RepID=UPI00399C1E99